MLEIFHNKILENLHLPHFISQWVVISRMMLGLILPRDVRIKGERDKKRESMVQWRKHRSQSLLCHHHSGGFGDSSFFFLDLSFSMSTR